MKIIDTYIVWYEGDYKIMYETENGYYIQKDNSLSLLELSEALRLINA